MPFYLSRLDTGVESYLYFWNREGTAWGPDQTRAHRFTSAGEALDAAAAFDRRDLTHLGQICIVEA
jgi:hypothetical protein